MGMSILRYHKEDKVTMEEYSFWYLKSLDYLLD